jgi:hypothetical protein
MLLKPLPVRIGGTCSTTRTRHPHGNRHSPPTGTEEISTLTGFTGLFISARRVIRDSAGQTTGGLILHRIGQGTTTAHRAILERLVGLPGVTPVSASTCLPRWEQGSRAQSGRGLRTESVNSTSYLLSAAVQLTTAVIGLEFACAGVAATGESTRKRWPSAVTSYRLRPGLTGVFSVVWKSGTG